MVHISSPWFSEIQSKSLSLIMWCLRRSHEISCMYRIYWIHTHSFTLSEYDEPPCRNIYLEWDQLQSVKLHAFGKLSRHQKGCIFNISLRTCGLLQTSSTNSSSFIFHLIRKPFDRKPVASESVNPNAVQIQPACWEPHGQDFYGTHPGFL